MSSRYPTEGQDPVFNMREYSTTDIEPQEEVEARRAFLQAIALDSTPQDETASRPSAEVKAPSLGLRLGLFMCAFCILFAWVVSFSSMGRHSMESAWLNGKAELYFLPGDKRLLAWDDNSAGKVQLHVQKWPFPSFDSPSLSAHLFLTTPPALNNHPKETTLSLEPLLAPESTKRVLSKFLLAGSRVELTWSADSSNQTSSQHNGLAVLILKGEEAYVAWRSKRWDQVMDPLHQIYHTPHSPKGQFSFAVKEMNTYFFIFIAPKSNVGQGMAQVSIWNIHYETPFMNTTSTIEGLAESCSLTHTCEFLIPALTRAFILVSESNPNNTVLNDITDIENDLIEPSNSVLVSLNYDRREGDKFGPIPPPDAEQRWHEQQESLRQKIKRAYIVAGFLLTMFFMTCVFGFLAATRRRMDSSSNIELYSLEERYPAITQSAWMNHGPPSARWLNIFLGIDSGLYSQSPSVPVWVSDPLPVYPGQEASSVVEEEEEDIPLHP